VTDVVVTATGSIPRAQVDAAREHVASALGAAGASSARVQLTLRRSGPDEPAGGYVADALAFSAGRVIAAHASGTMPVDAAGAVAERLIGKWPAHRGPPR